MSGTTSGGTTLIVGGDSQIGRALVEFYRSLALPVVGTTRRKQAPDSWHLNLAEPPDHWIFPDGLQSAVICAALTSLQQCRLDPSDTRQINVERTVQLAKQLAQGGCFVVFISTNLVFDGSQPLRKPDDSVCPITEYGRQKAETEAALKPLGDGIAIVRLTKLFHRDLPLVRQWREQIARGEIVHAFADLFCSPVPMQTVVQALSTIANRRAAGTWHVSPPETLSYVEIAECLAEEWNAHPKLVHPVPAPDSIPPENRPRWTSLDATATRETLGIHIPSALQTIQACA